MGIVDGVHHVTFLTEDIERLSAFYERVFEAKRMLDLTEEGVRHVFLDVGGSAVLHPFQILDGPELPPAPGTMFERGRLDHFALRAPSEEAFREIRRRLDAESAVDGDVRDMHAAWILGFHDPDGFYAEVMWERPGIPVTETRLRGEGETVELG